MLLTRADLDVHVWEKESSPGGRTKIVSQDGFRFDKGPTFLIYLDPLRSIFRSVGLTLDEEIELICLEPNYRLVFGDGSSLKCFKDEQKMKSQIKALAGVHDAEGFSRYMADTRKKLNITVPCLESPWPDLKSLFSRKIIRLARVLLPARSMMDELGRYFQDPRVMLSMSFQSKYLGMSPFKASSLFTILSFIEYEYGIFHPIGGLGSVTYKMAELAQELGVKLHMSSPVERVIVQDRKAVGLRVNGENYRSDAVVMNADFAKYMMQLTPSAARKKWTDKHIRKKEFSCSTFMLYLGIKGLYNTPHHQIYLSNSYRENLEDIEDRHMLTWKDPSIYVQNACVTDPTLAPEGCSTLYVLCPVTHQSENVNWEEVSSRFREVVLDQMEKLGFEGVRDRIITAKTITPEDWAGSIYKGATFNMKHNLAQMFHNRPGNRFRDIGNMYIVGGGTHPGSGLPVIFESSIISSKLLLEDLEVETNWDSMTMGFPG